MKKKLAAGLATLACLVLPAASTAPAQASINSDYKICNSSGSDHRIQASDLNRTATLYAGDCAVLDNYNNAVRVDTYPLVSPCSTGNCSYKIGHIDYGYGPCHVTSSNHNSDPPNDYSDTGARYKVYYNTSCQE